jgi:hypothetical protein
MYTNQFSSIKDFARGIKRGTFGLYAATFTEKKMNKYPNGTTPAERKTTPVNPYLDEKGNSKVFTLAVYQNAATGLNYYNIVKGECEREGIHFSKDEFELAFPKEATYCEAEEDALANIILKHNDKNQEYLRLYKGRKPTKVAYFTICDDEIVEEGSELMNDILRYVPASKPSAKQEALGIRNIVEVKQPKIENVILLAQSDNIFINPDFKGLANHIMDNLENIFKKK